MDSEHLGGLIECSVCLDTLGIDNRVLPCQHTFCKSCLEALQEVNGYLKCPECRMVHHDLTVDDLHPNVILNRILEGFNKKKQEDSDSDTPISPPKPKVAKRRRKIRTIDQLIYSESEEDVGGNAGIEFERDINSDGSYSPGIEIKSQKVSRQKRPKQRKRNSLIEETDSDEDQRISRRDCRTRVVDIDKPSTSRMGMEESSDSEEIGTRISRRISNRRTKQKFQMPSRKELFDSIASPKGKENYDDEIKELRPRKSVNNLVICNSSYNRETTVIDDSELDDFIDDDYDYIDESSFLTTDESDASQNTATNNANTRKRIKKMDCSSDDNRSRRKLKSKKKAQKANKKKSDSLVVDSDESDSSSGDSYTETSLNSSYTDESFMDTESETGGTASRNTRSRGSSNLRRKSGAKVKSSKCRRRLNKSFISESESEEEDETKSRRASGKHKSKTKSQRAKKSTRRRVRESSSDTSTSSSFDSSSELLSSDSTPPRGVVKRKSTADDFSDSSDSMAGKRKSKKRKSYEMEITKRVKIRKTVTSKKKSSRCGKRSSRGAKK